jgi:nitrate/nitrite transport system substrate-binding protein
VSTQKTILSDKGVYRLINRGRFFFGVKAMSYKSLDDPFSPDTDLRHGAGCGCSACRKTASQQHAQNLPDRDYEETVDRAVESAVVRALFGQDEMSRRRFMQMVGGGTFAAALASVFPLEAAKAMLKDNLGAPEKADLNVGFVPITCATPIIMGEPLGFYERYGLNVKVIKTAGWAVARDKSLNGEYDAAHMLTPMPLAISMGAGSQAEPWLMPAVENINGQAITLHNKHKDKRDPAQWKGMTFAVPFDYSMHNFLLRYYVAEHGLDPDQDIQIRVLPPPEMVANLRAGNVDGYLAPDPFNCSPVRSGTVIPVVPSRSVSGSRKKTRTPSVRFSRPLSMRPTTLPIRKIAPRLPRQSHRLDT